MLLPPVEVLKYFSPVCDVFGKHRVFRSRFITQEFWSTQYDNDRELQRTVSIRFSISEDELQQKYSWLDSGLQNEHEVQPGVFFGNADCGESDEIFLRIGNTKIRGDVSSETGYTQIEFETPPDLFTEELWDSHRAWFEEHAL